MLAVVDEVGDDEVAALAEQLLADGFGDQHVVAEEKEGAEGQEEDDEDARERA